MEKVEEYKITADDLIIPIAILGGRGVVKQYHVYMPTIAPGTKALIDYIKHGLVTEVAISTQEILDPKAINILKEKFTKRAQILLKDKLPTISQDTATLLINILMQEMLGLGDVEYLLADEQLEEIVITSSKEPVRVYHKKHGWLETNITLENEDKILNYANIIGRRVGRQITTLNPLLDAHLVTGDRANAVLFPICTKGHTITIRRFARDPWTLVDFIKNNTVTSKLLALIWLAIQYEMNLLISGGTASGKTSFLNICMPFIPHNHRVVSIEDTRELQLPRYLYWCPLTVRQPNPEGKGEVCLYPGSFFVSGNGELREISSYVEEKLSRGNKKTKANMTAIEGDGDTVLAGDPRTFSYAEEKIKMYSKITGRKYICTISCEDGTTFSITENTKLPVITKEGKLSLLNPFEIREKGSRIPLLTRIQINAKPQRVKLFDVLDKKDVYACGIKKEYILLEKDLKKRYTLNALADVCGVKRQSFTYYRKTGLVNMYILKKLALLSQTYNLNFFEKKITRLKGKGNSLPVFIPRIVEKDLAYFAGFVLAEKYINKNKIYISQKENIFTQLNELVKKLFGLSLVHKKGRYNDYRIFSSVVSYFMRDLFSATKSSDISVPSIIMRSPDDVIASFLAGYIDGDGTIRKNSLSLTSMSEKMIKGVKYLFTRLGIRASTSLTKGSGFSNKTFYNLHITTRLDAQKACHLLPFRMKNNFEKAKLLLQQEFEEGTARNRIPTSLIKHFLDNLKQHLTEQERYQYYYRYAEKPESTIARTRIGNLVNLLSRRVHTTKTEEESLKALSELSSEDIEYVKIKNVTIKENIRNIPSYDLTPERSKYFVAGNGNFTLVEDTMLDLLVNSLRMRPDRIILGEMRKKDQAEVLFEAMHTGHSVYATVHADSVSETIERLVNPPIEVPQNLLLGVNLNVVMFRDRRRGLRRVFQVGEFLPTVEEGVARIRPNILYRWKPSTDEIVEHGTSVRLFEELSRHTGMTLAQIEKDILRKKAILDWMVKNNIRHVDQVGEVIRNYYLDPDSLLEQVEKDGGNSH